MSFVILNCRLIRQYEAHQSAVKVTSATLSRDIGGHCHGLSETPTAVRATTTQYRHLRVMYCYGANNTHTAEAGEFLRSASIFTDHSSSSRVSLVLGI